MKRRRGQGIVEYVLLLAAFIVVVLLAGYLLDSVVNPKIKTPTPTNTQIPFTTAVAATLTAQVPVATEYTQYDLATAVAKNKPTLVPR